MNVNILEARLRGFHRDPIYLDPDEIEKVDSCPACASREGQRVLAVARGLKDQALQLGQCTSCSHVYLQSRPTAEWFDKYYSEDWDTGSTSQNQVKVASRARRMMRRNRFITKAVRAQRVLRHDMPAILHPSPARLMQMISGLGEVKGDEFPYGWKLLDIGCGYGGSLLFLHEFGLDTWGTEANAHRAAVARSLGLNVIHTIGDDFSPVQSAAPFDLVYSSHVFEHLADLDRMMEAIDPLVSPDGFVYLEVPHGPVTEDIIIRTHIPVHCHLFSASSLSALLRRYGYHPVRVLVDTNLHLVARRSEEPIGIHDVSVPAGSERIVHGLFDAIGEPDTLKIAYEQHHIEVRRSIDDSLVYKRNFPYGVYPVGVQGRDEFLIEIEAKNDREPWPIYFQHPTYQAPIWMKYG
jgi:2-polyprenyl-3-methyl-5-hydroxy-6-metoxy-1,4-benzoquinol methylase